jgi:hypothetical protein
MEDSVAEVTVKVVFPEMLPEVAVMVAVPGVMGVPSPLLLIDATDGLEDCQVTCVVISWLVPSEYVPEAVNCSASPTGMLGLAGVTAMEDSVAEVTVRVVFPPKSPVMALMVAVPGVIAVARPLGVTVTTDGLVELQATCVVMS